MRIFPKNLATFEQENFFHILIWDRAYFEGVAKQHLGKMRVFAPWC